MKSILLPPHPFSCQSKESVQDQVNPYESVSWLTEFKAKILFLAKSHFLQVVIFEI